MPSPFAGTRQAIEAPPASPPRYSLLFAMAEITRDAARYVAAAGPGITPPPSAPDDLRWENGVKWGPEETDGGGVVSLNCSGGTDSISPDTGPGEAHADPFVVWASDKCSSLGWGGRDFEGRARRQLEATQSFRMANELWLGTEAQASALDNEWLTDDPLLLTGAAVAPMEALALVDMGLGHMLDGRRGMIHVSPQTLTELATNEAIQMNGQLWLSAMGNIVVSDAGYPGDGPDADNGGKQWIYGTALVGYRLGPVQIIPDSFTTAQKIAQSMNRSINDIQIVAERMVLLQWDSTIPAGNKTGVLAAETTTAAFAAL